MGAGEVRLALGPGAKKSFLGRRRQSPTQKPKAEKTFFFLPFKIKKGYVNTSYKIKVGESDNMRTLRSIMKDTYGVEPGSFVVSTVYNNNFSRLHASSANLMEVANEQGATLLYEIDPSMSPSMP